jgi:diguanylate cyclase (GGDEF)-like protein
MQANFGSSAGATLSGNRVGGLSQFVLVGLGFALATVVSFGLGRVFPFASAAVWVYLPLILVVTVRWGLVPGLGVGLLSNVLTLTFLVPIGLPIATNPLVYVRIALATAVTAIAIVTVAHLDRRRRLAERQGRVEAETLAELGRRISVSLHLDDVLQTTAEAGHRLARADLTTLALLDAGNRLPVTVVIGNRTPLLSGVSVSAASGTAGPVLANGHPVQKHWDRSGDGLAHDPQAVRALAAEGIVSTLAVPIRLGAEIIGLFWVHSRHHREWTGREVALLRTLADQAGAAIANARAHAEVEALLAATAKLGEQSGPEEVLRTIVEEAGKLLGAERAMYAVLRDGRLIVPADFRDGAWIPDGEEARLHGLLWSVWETGRPYRVDDVGADPNANLERVRMHQSRSQLTVALQGSDGENLGLVSLNNKRGATGFSERDERLLTAFCETGAAILRRANETAARLDAERNAARSKREVEALLAAADQLNSTLDSDEVLRRVVSLTAELVGVERAGIATNEGTHALRRQAWLDGVWKSAETPVPLEGSTSGWVITHAKPYRTEAFGRDRPVSAGSYAMAPQMVLSVPILGSEGQVLGALSLFDRRDGQPFSDGDQRLAEGIAHHAAVAMERAKLVEALRAREQLLHVQAVTDPLTGLPNRTLFLDRLAPALVAARRSTKGIGVLFLDLDAFKVVNDSLGHAVGDQLLRAVAHRLQSICRDGDTVARFGGDEFAILLAHCETASAAHAIAERLVAELRRPLRLGKHRTLSVTASIGVAFQPGGMRRRSAEELLREADIALYQAKAAGRARAVPFAPSMSADASERLGLLADLERAIERHELRLLYQPIWDLETRHMVGVEALLRWQHPHRGRLDPHAFIPLAEETGLIVPIGHWVLEEACRQAAIWRDQLSGLRPFQVNVNLSPVQLERRELVDDVAELLRRFKLAPDALRLEITEGAVVRDAESTIPKLTALQNLGVQLAIDDFGTGYSSLSYLQRLPIGTVKIDQSFMQGITSGGSTAAIVRAVITLAHALGMAVTAEGVETADQVAFLTTIGCDQAQGFYFRPPSTPSELASAFLDLCDPPQTAEAGQAR